MDFPSKSEYLLVCGGPICVHYIPGWNYNSQHALSKEVVSDQVKCHWLEATAVNPAGSGVGEGFSTTDSDVS